MEFFDFDGYQQNLEAYGGKVRIQAGKLIFGESATC